MVVHHSVEGYDEFLKFAADANFDGPTFVLYTGSDLPNGKSWCPDCVEAEPHIEKGMKDAPANTHFVTVKVGDRAFWKDPKCPFRTNSQTQLKVLPTLVRWATERRLEGNQLLNPQLIEMILEEEN